MGLNRIFAERGSTQTNVLHNVGCAVHFFPDYDHGFVIRGKIDTLPSAVMVGENDCTHLNLDGTIFPAGSLSYAGSRTVSYNYQIDGNYWTRDYPVTTVTEPGNPFGPVQYTHLVEFNINFAYDFSFVDGSSGTATNNQLMVAWRWYAKDTFLLLEGQNIYSGVAHTKRCNIDGFIVQHPIGQGYRFQAFSASPLGWFTGSEELWTKYSVNSSITAVYTKVKKLPYAWTQGLSLCAKHVEDSSITGAAFIEPIFDNIRRCLPFHDFDMGEMSYNCVMQFKDWDNNGIALAKDLVGTIAEVKDLIKLLKGIRNPKNWASLYLSSKYGLALTLSDIRSLVKALSTSKTGDDFSKVSSSASWSDGETTNVCHYGMYYQPYDGDYLYYKLSRIDAWPDYVNVWDLIPFSFVVDWLVDIGGYLDRVDQRRAYNSYYVRNDIISQKVTRIVEPRLIGLRGYDGFVNISRYVRTHTPNPSVPSLKLNVIQLTDFDHWVEAGALIVQKFFH